jgi:hypothetical protein
MDRATRDKLRHIQDLLSHAVPSGDINEVFVRALDTLEAQLEKRMFSRTERPRAMRGSANPRCIPAAVRRAVAERDGGRCTFVSETGHRCAATRLLEFDHVEEVARGGQANRGRPAATLPDAQSVHCGADVWCGVHGSQASRSTRELG